MVRHSLLCAAALTVACSGAGEAGVAETPASDAEYTDTIVSLDADGNLQQTIIAVSAEARRAELARATKSDTGESTRQGGIGTQQQALLTTNTRCAGSDLWVYDANRQNRLCISGAHLDYNRADSLDFNTIRYGFCLYVQINGACVYNRWAGNVAWIWPGSNAGQLYSSGFSSEFSAWGPLQQVDPARAGGVWLYGPR